MLVEKEKIQKAKEKLGDENARIISELLNAEQYDEHNRRALCPHHKEKTPSWIYNAKAYSFHCFACGKNTDIIDAYMETGLTYIQSVQKLFEHAGVKYSFGEHGVRDKAQYRYPKEEPQDDKSHVYQYLALRCISAATVDYADVREDAHGNIVFNYYDTNDVLKMVKYRPSRRVEKGENKMWCQKGADTTPLLFNMNRINTTEPLIVCEGELDCLALIESGCRNTVSVPLGAQNYGWIEENWDWLEQFESIILCGDNDDAGRKMINEVAPRLGTWRVKVAELPTEITLKSGNVAKIKDANDVLYRMGVEALRNAILNAKDSPVPSAVDFADIPDVDLNDIDGIQTGYNDIDQSLLRLFYGTFNIISGTPGCVDSETEYFNGTRWVKISKYEPGDKVLQYESDGSARLVYPSEYHKYPESTFYHIKSHTGLDQMLSLEHNVVYLTSKGHIAKKPMHELLAMHEKSKYGFQGKVPTAFNYEGEGIDMSDEQIRVMCAVIADGTFNNFSQKAKTYNRVRINIKKERKKERLRILLQRANIHWDEKVWNNTDRQYTNFLFQPPLRTKIFPAEWYQCSQRQLAVIADEIKYWDGNVRRGITTFSTTCKDNADFIQFVLSSMGKRASIIVDDRVGKFRGKYERKSIAYTVRAVKNRPYIGFCSYARGKMKIKPTNASDGFKYCFTVPSGMLVLRRNNCINITGNSGKTSILYQVINNAMDENVNCWIYSRELNNWLSKNWQIHIFAGNRNNKECVDTKTNAKYYIVPKEIKAQISEFYRGRLTFYRDDYPNDKDSILQAMIDSRRKYGARVFLLDNLMTINLGGNDENINERQTAFVNELIQFAVKYDACVILVAHPRKMIVGQTDVGIYDIAGSSNIINLAHRAIGLRRVTNEEKCGEKQDKNGRTISIPVNPYSIMVTVIKDRLRGMAGQQFGLHYDKPSRRFFSNPAEYDKQYKWDKHVYKDPLPYPIEDGVEEVFGKIK